MARARKTRPSELAWRGRPLPLLDERHCIGCGWCVAICPVDCLGMAEGFPLLIRAAACVSCGLCADVCPTRAITMASRSADLNEAEPRT